MIQTPKINLIHGDCMELLRQTPDNYYSLCIVDPPYQGCDAIGLINSKGHSAKRTKYKVFDNIRPDQEYFEELRRVSKNQIVWGGNFFGLSGGVIAWNKNGTAFGEGEVAICSTHKSVKFFEFTWNGMIQGNMKDKEVRFHPTQKPVALYKWLLSNYAKPGDRILDTHGGSMSIAIACYDLGFDLDLTELDKDYYDAGVARFERHRAQGQLFHAPAAQLPEQQKMF